MKWKYLLPALTLTVCGCIDEYKLPQKVSESYQEEIVVDGRILSGEESVFYVTRTMPLLSGKEKMDIVTDAQVKVIGEDGYESELAVNIEDAKYVVDTGILPTNTNYAVEVKVGNEVFRSDFQPLLETPEVSDLKWDEVPGKVRVLISTGSENEEQKYYMWSYEEDWQFHVMKDMNEPGKGVPLYNSRHYPDFVPGKENPYYFCFGHANSGTVLIYSTEGLKDNKVVNHELLAHDANDIKISYLYSILVKQWSLTHQAYEYYRLMKLYTEDSGGLFTPMPTDVRGNVKCVSDESVKARGYVVASTVKEKRIFIDAEDYKITVPGSISGYYTDEKDEDGRWMPRWSEWIRNAGYVAFATEPTLVKATIIYAPECVNCLLVDGATKERPSFWPKNK